MCNCKPDYRDIIKEIKHYKNLEDTKYFDYVTYNCDFCKKVHIEYPHIRKCPECKKCICSSCDKFIWTEDDINNVCACNIITNNKICNICKYYYCDTCSGNIQECEECENINICFKCSDVIMYKGLWRCATHVEIYNLIK